MKKKIIKKKLWMAVDKDDGEILQVSLIGKDDLNIWDDSIVVKAEVTFEI